MISVLFTLALFAAADDWGRLQALRTGSKVTVVQVDRKSLTGKLAAVSSEEIVVDSTTIPKARVVRVSTFKGTRRASNAVVLGIVGGLIGAGITRFGVACAETNDGCQNAALAAIGGTAGGAAIGAFALPAMMEVYRVKVISPTSGGHPE